MKKNKSLIKQILKWRKRYYQSETNLQHIAIILDNTRKELKTYRDGDIPTEVETKVIFSALFAVMDKGTYRQTKTAYKTYLDIKKYARKRFEKYIKLTMGKDKS